MGYNNDIRQTHIHSREAREEAMRCAILPAAKVAITSHIVRAFAAAAAAANDDDADDDEDGDAVTLVCWYTFASQPGENV